MLIPYRIVDERARGGGNRTRATQTGSGNCHEIALDASGLVPETISVHVAHFDTLKVRAVRRLPDGQEGAFRFRAPLPRDADVASVRAEVDALGTLRVTMRRLSKNHRVRVGCSP